MNEEPEQSRRHGKIGRITGLAYATPAPVSFFRSRQALSSNKENKKSIQVNDEMIV
jgi:hypothetical protein